MSGSNIAVFRWDLAMAPAIFTKASSIRTELSCIEEISGGLSAGKPGEEAGIVLVLGVTVLEAEDLMETKKCLVLL